MPLLDTEYILRVLLVFVRVSGLLVAAPVFGQQTLPVQVRVLAGALLAYSVAGFADGPLPDHVTHNVGFAMVLLVEAATGLLMGFAARLLFWAVDFAGSIMGFQMALSLAQTYNPMSGTSSNPLGRILSYTFLLAFLLADGHHLLLRALVRSFEVLPLGTANLAAGGPLLLEYMGAFFHIALRLAAPFLAVLFLSDVALGIFARVIPQANLFALSLPVKLLIGLSVFFLVMQGLIPSLPPLFERIDRMVLEMIEALTPA
jgi:flagellar biosynthetic protein FliR